MKGDTNVNEKAALIVGCGGVGSHVAQAIRHKFPNKKLILADYSQPKIAEEMANVEYISIDLFKDDVSVLSGLDMDTLFISVGIGRLSGFETFNSTEIEKNFRVNCISTIQLINKYYEKMMLADNFYCAIVTSIAGIVASPLYSIYSATKGALVKFIEAVNAELEYKGSKNKIVDIAPGYIGGTGFHGGTCSEAEFNNLNRLADQFVAAMYNRDDLCIPNFEQTYSRVISSYYNNPSQFALESMRYNLSNNVLNDKPQIKTGYLTGTFDLFHIGHLNLLRNAKKYCDRLIVGIHPDGKHKNKEVFIPLEERMEIVRNIKYVDDVMVCTDEDIDAYPLLKFDYLFVGSDYKGTERFRRYEEYLSDKGAKVIYLPYTTKTSSTYLRSLISQRLTEDKK